MFHKAGRLGLNCTGNLIAWKFRKCIFLKKKKKVREYFVVDVYPDVIPYFPDYKALQRYIQRFKDTFYWLGFIRLHAIQAVSIFVPDFSYELSSTNWYGC